LDAATVPQRAWLGLAAGRHADAAGTLGGLIASLEAQGEAGRAQRFMPPGCIAGTRGRPRRRR